MPGPQDLAQERHGFAQPTHVQWDACAGAGATQVGRLVYLLYLMLWQRWGRVDYGHGRGGLCNRWPPAWAQGTGGGIAIEGKSRWDPLGAAGEGATDRHRRSIVRVWKPWVRRDVRKRSGD